MLDLRPYRENDAERILSWCGDERTFYRWTAGVLGDYPLTAVQFINRMSGLTAFTAVEDGEPAGFFTLRRPGEAPGELRVGFVIVDAQKRGRGYGKELLRLALKLAREIYGAKRVSLGVFEDNRPARCCYRAVGFVEVASEKTETYHVMGEDWSCVEMELVFEPNGCGLHEACPAAGEQNLI